MTESIEPLRAVLRAQRSRLQGKSHVVATGIGYKVTRGRRSTTPCIVCSVSRKLAASELSASDLLPASVDGVPTDVVQTGVIRALASRTDRYRPAPGGVSIGHRDITAGTLGCLVRRNGLLYILSNNHVLANSNAGAAGDPILQPGPYDGGKLPQDQIAVLSDFVPIGFIGGSSGCSLARGAAAMLNAGAALVGSNARLQAVTTRATENLVDAAIARPINDADVSADILDIGVVTGLGAGSLGLAIRKSGRTTALTSGEITQVDVTVSVQYGAGQVAVFSDQLMAGAMSQGGDSGSAVVDNNNRLVGLLFAGSDSTTIINRIEHVFSALGLSL